MDQSAGALSISDIYYYSYPEMLHTHNKLNPTRNMMEKYDSGFKIPSRVRTYKTEKEPSKKVIITSEKAKLFM